MKKILIIILALSLFSCQEKMIKSRYTPVNVGTTANDGTGDNLRAAFIKVNAGFAEIADSLENIYTEAQTRAVISDTITQRIEDAVEITDIMPSWSDTTGTFGGLVSWSQLVNYVSTYGGGGTSSGWDISQFTIGVTTGAPDNADSVYTQSSFIGKNIGLYRDGLRQTLNFTATNTQEGFRNNSTTGTITVNPPFSSGEQIIIAIDEPISYTYIPIEGEESSLLTDLMGFWKFDESTGSAFVDELGLNNGTSTATLGVAGRFGYGQLFNGLGDYSRVPYATELSVTGLDSLTISIWVKLDSVDITNGQNLVTLKTNDANYWSALVRVDADNALVFYLKNSSGTTYEANTANDAFSVGTWYNVICTLDATTMAIYIDNVSSATSADTFSGTLLPYNDHIYFGTGSASSVSYTRGTIDSPGLWSRTIVSGERATLQTLTYPF